MSRLTLHPRRSECPSLSLAAHADQGLRGKGLCASAVFTVAVSAHEWRWAWSPLGWAWLGLCHPPLVLLVDLATRTISFIKPGSEPRRFNYSPRGNWHSPPHHRLSLSHVRVSHMSMCLCVCLSHVYVSVSLSRPCVYVSLTCLCLRVSHMSVQLHPGESPWPTL